MQVSNDHRIALISDIHSNLEALEVVLAEIDRLGIANENIYNLGDTVGYGPDPVACLNTILERGIPTIDGNHDVALWKGPMYFNEHAAASLYINKRIIEEESPGLIDEVKKFPKYILRKFEYDDGTIRILYGIHNHSESKNYNYNIYATGHTHRRALIELNDHTICVNPGSVGQPRQGGPGAYFAVVETYEKKTEFFRMPYDVEKTISKINKRGIPEIEGTRLR